MSNTSTTVAEFDTPSAAAIEAVHADIVAESQLTEPGVRTPAAVESALTYVSDGYFGAAPETIHESATHLVRLLVADHPFVDGNKRTALSAAVLLYELNGRVFAYEDGPIRETLKRFASDASPDVSRVTEQFRQYAETAPIDDERQSLRRRGRQESGEAVEAVRRLAALDRERNPETYERLATE